MSDEDEIITGSVKTSFRELFNRTGRMDQDLTRLDTEVKGVRSDLVEIKTLLTTKLNKGTDWNIPIAAAILVLAICGGVGKLVVDPLVGRIASLEAEQLEHRKGAVLVATLAERSRWQTFAITGEMGE
jgi:hypothetical protein